MKLESVIEHPQAPPELVYRMMLDPAFREAVCTATEASEREVRIEEHEDGTATVRVQRTMPADVSDFVKAIVGEQVTILQEETWRVSPNDGRRADLVISVLGRPARMIGTIAISPENGGSTLVVRGNVKVSIPLIGRRIEPEVHRAIRTAVTTEGQVGVAWLTA